MSRSGQGSRSGQRSALGLAGLLAAAAAVHFGKPEVFDPTIPPTLPGTARQWVIGSGVAELGTAALIAAPPTRRLGGLAAAALFAAVFPANVKMAVDAWRDRDRRPGYLAAMIVRLPIQLPLVLWGLRIRRSSAR